MSANIALKHPLFTLLALLALPPMAAAGTYTPDSAASYALAHNPGLAAARLGVDQARARLLQAGGLSNPELESEVRPNLAGREFSLSVGFSQRFPLTHRLRLEKAVSSTGVALAESEVHSASRTLDTQVRELAIKLQALSARQEINRRQQVAARDLAAAITKAAAAGETPPLEAAQLELEVSRLSIIALQDTTERATLAGALRPLLGCPATEPILITGTLPAPVIPPANVTTPAQHPDYRTALTKAEAARQTIDLARANRWEDLTVAIGYERSREEDAGAGMQRDNIAVLRFSLPLPLKKRNAGLVAETIATAERTTLEASATAARLRAEAAAALDEMKAFTAIHQETTTKLLPQAEALENRFNQLQKNGQATLPDVLRARQQRLTLESAGLDARRDFHLARLRYQAASGL
jgi:cobalt-zinc-cadmium efflux system outer membrane protein